MLAQLLKSVGFEMNFKKINDLRLLIEQKQNIPENIRIYA